MKKIFCAALVFCMFFTVGCNGGNDGDKKGTITWNGIDEVQYVTAGDPVDLMQNLTAVDSIDGDITNKVVILNDVDNEAELSEQGWLMDYVEFDSNLLGQFFVYYKVSNSSGVTEYKERTFVVQAGHNVLNGMFTLGKAFWTLDAPGGSASWSIGEDGM